MFAITLFSLMFGLAAADTSVVFLAPFESLSAEATELSDSLPENLRVVLDSMPSIQTISLNQIGSIHEVSAAEYAAGCPPTEFVGCAFLLGETGQANYAVTGTVSTMSSGHRVDVRIVDIGAAREAAAVRIDVADGDNVPLTEGVVRLLNAVIRGDVGTQTDVRDQMADVIVDESNIEAQSSDLQQLDQEIGDVSTLTERQDVLLIDDVYTLEDLNDDINTEGTKPWEQFDMEPYEFFRYKNSDLSLSNWRQLSRGRRGRVMIRPGVGVIRGPNHGAYYGRVSLSNQTLEIAETYAWQTLETGTGLCMSASIGYGIRPDLEISLLGGVSTGRYLVDIHRVIVNDFSTPPSAEDFTNQTLFVGPQVLIVPRPTYPIRPVIGAQLQVWQTTTVDNHILPPSGLPNSVDGSAEPLPPPRLLTAGIIAGVELRLNNNIDLYAHLPVNAVIMTWDAPATHHSGSGYLEDLQAPRMPDLFSGSLTLGFQVRTGGNKQRRRLEDYE